MAHFEKMLYDQAQLVSSYLDAYQITRDEFYASIARETLQYARREMTGKEVGFYSAPAGNSIAMLNLLRPAQMTDNRKWREMADRTLALFSGRLNEFPQAAPQMLAALDYHLDKPKQIIIAGQRGKEDTEKMLREAHARYIPNKIILLADGGEGQQFLSQYLPFIETVKMRGGKATAYICENYACKLPTSDLSVMAKLLGTEEEK